MSNQFGNALKKYSKITVVVSLLVLFFFCATAQSADQASSTGNYEELLDKYYNMKYGDAQFAAGLVNSYRMFTNKTDDRFSYLESADFVNAARVKFKENWKTQARKILTLKELQFLVVYFNSKTKRNFDAMKGSMYPQELEKLFRTIPVPAVQPANAAPAKPAAPASAAPVPPVPPVKK